MRRSTYLVGTEHSMLLEHAPWSLIGLADDVAMTFGWISVQHFILISASEEELTNILKIQHAEALARPQKSYGREIACTNPDSL